MNRDGVCVCVCVCVCVKNFLMLIQVKHDKQKEINLATLNLNCHGIRIPQTKIEYK
jgi:hypothetical protein